MKKKESAVKKREEKFLAVDAGNSRTRFGLFHGDRFAGSANIAGADARSYSAGRLAGEIVELNGGLKADACMLSSVVPGRNEFLLDVCRRACSAEPVLLTHDMDAGVKFRYENPGELGLDRFAAAAACRELYPGKNVIIIDAGTALTFGVLRCSGEFAGGMIAPGPGLQAEGLAEKAALLPPVEIARPPSLIAVNTARGIQSGVFYGFLEMTAGLVRRLKRELGDEAFVIATGWWSEILGEFSGAVDKVDPFLVLRGIRIIHKRNLKP